VHGLVTICHEVRKGGHDGSHWPKHWRASSLLDYGRWVGEGRMTEATKRCGDVATKGKEAEVLGGHGCAQRDRHAWAHHRDAPWVRLLVC